VVAGRDREAAEAEFGAARAGIGDSFRDAFQARHPNLIRTEEQLAYFDDVVMTDFWERYEMAEYGQELDTTGGIEEFIRGVVEGVDADQFITPAVIGPTRLQREEALTQQKVNAEMWKRNAQRAAVAESERLTGERAALEGVVPGLQMAAAGDEGFERFLFEELPGMRTDYNDELAARREVMAREVAEQSAAWKVAGYEATQKLKAGAPPSFPGAGLVGVPPDTALRGQELGPLGVGIETVGPDVSPGMPPDLAKSIMEDEVLGVVEKEEKRLQTTQGYAQDPALYAAIGADAARAEREGRPDWEEYLAGKIPGMRATYTQRQEEREALFAPPGSETRRIMDENREAREQYDREAAQERRQRTLTKAVPGVRVQRTRARY
jgi:hypothetical protein